MRRSCDFTATVRDGRRARRGLVVVHHRPASGDGPALIGFVVGRSIGGSVARHRVSRRLRALTAARLGALPPSSCTVVRALAAAATASSAELAGDLDAALRRVGALHSEVAW
jgi:ribonuclease P protein component